MGEIELIDELITEHRQIGQNMKKYKHVIDDLCAAQELKDAKENLVPSRFADSRKTVEQLEKDLGQTVNDLEHHFNREEKALLDAFKRRGSTELASLLHELLSEHSAIRTLLEAASVEASELIADRSSRSVWEPKAWALRARIANVGRELESHASREEDLFRQAKQLFRGL
jgi:iron-sulfur cluster repair protein YtfE (RIC family)